MNNKEPIRLRQKKISKGNSSLYLDIYNKGDRDYEFLKLYLIPEKTKADRDKNRQTLQLAEAVKAQRIVELQNNGFGFKGKERLDTNFVEYFRQLTNERKGVWESVIVFVERFCPPNMTFKDVTPSWIKKFKNFLDTDTNNRRHQLLMNNSKFTYFSKIRACINQAERDEIIIQNPLKNISNYSFIEPERKYLTFDEIKIIANTPIKGKKRQAVKDVFLFSCLTGLRKSDILKLRWDMIQQQDGYTRIIFRQKKTKGQEYLDISPQAVSYMGERTNPEDLVFPKFKYSTETSKILREWIKSAGINKDITFHSARHTFAVLILDFGAEIYTLSKLLGHRNLKTTQIYAKILDKKKQEAINLIPQLN